MKDQWKSRLSEYLDGHLTTAEVLRMEEHLAECSDCRTALEELEGVVEAAGALEDRPPTRDLWPGILSRLGTGSDPQVIDLRARTGIGAPAKSEPSGGIRFSVPQLAAAALAVALFSGAGAWVLRGPAASGPGAAVGSADREAPVTTAVSRTQQPEAAGYAEEVARLEAVLDRFRGELSPNTVRILEKNLAVIDAAIAESRRALEVDPGNQYLESHLEGTLRRKVEFLRDATATLQASS